MKGIMITTANEITVQEFGRPLYKTVGAVVGGYIEHVHPKYLPEPYCMIVDEEGRLKDRQILNLVGSVLYGTPEHGQPIVGDIVIMKDGYDNGEPDIVGLSDEDVTHLRAFFAEKFNLKEK